MKRIILATMVASLMMSCAKEQLTNPKPTTAQQVEQKTDVKEKRAFGINMQFDMDPNGDGCKSGNSNCHYICCIQGSTLDDFMEAIDNGNEASYLTSSVINELSNGDSEVKDVLNDVVGGSLEVIYINSSTRVAFLFGVGVTETNYDYAHVIDKQ